MKAKDVKAGRVYEARVGGNLVPVRLDKVREVTKYRGHGVTDGSAFDVTNLKTGRKTTFRSAAKLRRELTQAQVDVLLGKAPAAKPTNKFTGDASEAKAIVDRIISSRPESATTTAPSSPSSPPHVIVEAMAGTGKTTTLVAGLQVLMGNPPTDAKGRVIVPSPQQYLVWEALKLSEGRVRTVCFAAFNRSIKLELDLRVPRGCEAKTVNGLGYGAVRKRWRLMDGDAGVNKFRTRDLTAELMGRPGESKELRRELPVVMGAVETLVNLCKYNLLWGSPEELDHLCDHYRVETSSEGTGESYRNYIYDLVPRVLQRAKEVDRDRCVDFADQVWLPVVMKLNVFRFDLLLVDEAQDLNRCQQELVKMASRRLVLCGDPRQAIYGFAGADARSIANMEKELAATPAGVVKLPLTVTRRCGKAVVAEANKIVTGFEAHESNPDGTVTTALYPTDADESRGTAAVPWEKSYGPTVEEGDMVLCRVNAPLVGQCFRFIRNGKTANIQGRDVGTGLVGTVKQLAGVKGNVGGDDDKDDPQAVAELEAVPVTDLIQRLEEYKDREVAKEQAKKNPSDARLIAVQDKYECLLCFTAEAKTAMDVVRKILAIFTDDRRQRCIRLSSIHKAKGLEADRVFLLQPPKCGVPHPMARSKWQIEQEWNLKYVAVTRAIKELVYVS